LEQGRAPAAIAYVTLSTALGLFAVALGAALARRF
jgi:fluoride ion exporter CrcB/FEX